MEQALQPWDPQVIVLCAVQAFILMILGYVLWKFVRFLFLSR